MLHKTSGVILHTTRYAETSIIAKVYTRHFGLQSYIINGVRNKKSANKAQLFQPLTLVDLVVLGTEKNKLKRISEITVTYHYADLHLNIIKSSIAIFINEILYKSLKEENADEELFDFIFHSLQILDLKHDEYSNFHLSFLLQLTKYLGFYPQGEYSLTTSCFDLQEGKYTATQPLHPYFLISDLSKKMYDFLMLSYEDAGLIKMSGIQRSELLHALLVFYRLHVNNFGEIKSLDVLKEILN
jgi:DNA repair protein RecO (recombination protein O)